MSSAEDISANAEPKKGLDISALMAEAKGLSQSKSVYEPFCKILQEDGGMSDDEDEMAETALASDDPTKKIILTDPRRVYPVGKWRCVTPDGHVLKRILTRGQDTYPGVVAYQGLQLLSFPRCDKCGYDSSNATDPSSTVKATNSSSKPINSSVPATNAATTANTATGCAVANDDHNDMTNNSNPYASTPLCPECHSELPLNGVFPSRSIPIPIPTVSTIPPSANTTPLAGAVKEEFPRGTPPPNATLFMRGSCRVYTSKGIKLLWSSLTEEIAVPMDTQGKSPKSGKNEFSGPLPGCVDPGLLSVLRTMSVGERALALYSDNYTSLLSSTVANSNNNDKNNGNNDNIRNKDPKHGPNGNGLPMWRKGGEIEIYVDAKQVSPSTSTSAQYPTPTSTFTSTSTTTSASSSVSSPFSPSSSTHPLSSPPSPLAPSVSQVASSIRFRCPNPSEFADFTASATRENKKTQSGNSGKWKSGNILDFLEAMYPLTHIPSIITHLSYSHINIAVAAHQSLQETLWQQQPHPKCKLSYGKFAFGGYFDSLNKVGMKMRDNEAAKEENATKIATERIIAFTASAKGNPQPPKKVSGSDTPDLSSEKATLELPLLSNLTAPAMAHHFHLHPTSQTRTSQNNDNKSASSAGTSHPTLYPASLGGSRAVTQRVMVIDDEEAHMVKDEDLVDGVLDITGPCVWEWDVTLTRWEVPPKSLLENPEVSGISQRNSGYSSSSPSSPVTGASAASTGLRSLLWHRRARAKQLCGLGLIPSGLSEYRRALHLVHTQWLRLYFPALVADNNATHSTGTTSAGDVRDGVRGGVRAPSAVDVGRVMLEEDEIIRSHAALASNISACMIKSHWHKLIPALVSFLSGGADPNSIGFSEKIPWKLWEAQIRASLMGRRDDGMSAWMSKLEENAHGEVAKWRNAAEALSTVVEITKSCVETASLKTSDNCLGTMHGSSPLFCGDEWEKWDISLVPGVKIGSLRQCSAIARAYAEKCGYFGDISYAKHAKAASGHVLWVKLVGNDMSTQHIYVCSCQLYQFALCEADTVTQNWTKVKKNLFPAVQRALKSESQADNTSKVVKKGFLLDNSGQIYQDKAVGNVVMKKWGKQDSSVAAGEASGREPRQRVMATPPPPANEGGGLWSVVAGLFGALRLCRRDNKS